MVVNDAMTLNRKKPSNGCQTGFGWIISNHLFFSSFGTHTRLLHHCYIKNILSYLISTYFDFHNLFSRLGGGAGRPQKFTNTQGSGPSNLVENVRGGLGDVTWIGSLGPRRRRGRASQQADRVRWDRSDFLTQVVCEETIPKHGKHKSLASGGWNTCLRFVHHMVRVVTRMLWTLAP